MPDRGVVADYSWLKGQIPDGELQKIQAAATDRPQVAATWAIQGRNLKKMSDAGVKSRLAPTATRRGRRTWKWRTWSRPA